MKKKPICIISIILIVLVVSVFAVKYWNSIILFGLTEDFKHTLKSECKVVEVKSTYGKLCGNGDGLQFFGAALVEKDSVKDLESVLRKLDKKFEIVEHIDQTTQEISIKYLNYPLFFKTDIDNYPEKYITVFFFNSRQFGANPFDLMGY